MSSSSTHWTNVILDFFKNILTHETVKFEVLAPSRTHLQYLVSLPNSTHFDSDVQTYIISTLSNNRRLPPSWHSRGLWQNFQNRIWWRWRIHVRDTFLNLLCTAAYAHGWTTGRIGSRKRRLRAPNEYELQRRLHTYKLSQHAAK